MKNLLNILLSAFGALIIVVTAGAALPNMKMTTPVPEGIETPSLLETHLGTLTSFDGVPDKETTQKIYDDLDLRRATEAFLNSLPIASLAAFKNGVLQFGPPNTTVLLFEDLMDSKSLWLTASSQSIYQFVWIELGDEPMVMETPPKVLGIIDDAWFQYVADFGNAGPDKGHGGKFLLVPPGYEGELPDGYYVVQCPTFNLWAPFRGFQVSGSTKPAIDSTKKLFRLYPLSQMDNPPKMHFVNASSIPNNTVHRMDFGYWEEVNQTIQGQSLRPVSIPRPVGCWPRLALKRAPLLIRIRG